MPHPVRFLRSSGLSLDLKLGARMLVKYPGLTLVGGIAMAFAIWIGAVVFNLGSQFLFPTLPLPGGDRVVYIENWDVSRSQAEPRALHDFLLWRDQLESVVDLGAYRDVAVNIGAGEGDFREAQGAEISAGAFRLASGTPLLGRVLTAADERLDAPQVVVLGYDVWQQRFAGDGAIVGKTVPLGDDLATIVGVMPKGFAFPVSHDLWLPLRVASYDRSPRAGPPIHVFGRLAAGATIEKAQAELTLIGRRTAAEFARTHEHLLPRVAKFTSIYWDPAKQNGALFRSINLFAIALLGLICGNVALLLFTRAATRETELIVRSALGASRARIVMQMFAEALVLGASAAVVGLGGAALALNRWGMQYLEFNLGRMPFWYDVRLSAPTVLYAIGLTLLAAVIAGVLPALKVTRAIASKLRQGTAGSGLRFSGIWTAVIVAQVAATVVFPAVVFLVQSESTRMRNFDVGFPAEQYLSVRLDLDPRLTSGADTAADRAAARAQRGTAIEALTRRLAGEPGVRGVTFIDRLPSMYHPEEFIELVDSTGIPAGLREVSTAGIDASYFEVLGAPIRSGRAFHGGDFAVGARTVIVDQGFVDQVLGGRNAVGRRIRIGDFRPMAGGEAEQWYEIVGVVKELGMGAAVQRDRAAGVYLPLPPGAASTVYMIVHADGDPLALTSKVRRVANAVDANLRLNEFTRLDTVRDEQVWFLRLWSRIIAVLTAIALLLSLAGIYAVLSFTVSRRTREIGVRIALGASSRRIVTSIFRRPLTQVAVGIALGAILVGIGAFAVSTNTPDAGLREMASRGGLSLGDVAALLGYALLMMSVCLLACVVPTRRALAVQPTEALRAE
jgi:predicted permease